MNMKKLVPICLLLIISGCKKEDVETPYVPFSYTDSVADNQGNYYHTVSIGSQVWMAENLRATKYRNGDTITYLYTSNDWSNTFSSATCAYDNNIQALDIYGKLYNFDAVTDSRNICPVGWHIPTQAEWQTLLDYLGETAGNKLREHGTKHWFPPNTKATDEYGFAALPGGWRNADGTCEFVRTEANFWSSTNYVPSNLNYPDAWLMEITNTDPNKPSAIIVHAECKSGCSVRCIKD
jgi:uncharacterized protein (TIGR02145 family)